MQIITNVSRNKQNIIEQETTIDFQCYLREHFNEAELKQLLENIGLKYHNVEEIKYLRPPSTDRFSLGLIMVDESESSIFNSNSNVIIDIRLGGHPTWEQFIDVTYDIGCSYANKIIIYDDKMPCYHLEGNDCSYIGDLVRINNECGVNTYLVKASGLMKYLLQGGAEQIKYKLMDGIHRNDEDIMMPVIKDGESLKQLPTKSQVQICQFWVSSLYIIRNVHQLNYEDITGVWCVQESRIMDLDMKFHWNEKGFFITLSGYVKSYTFNWLWTNKMPIIEEAYPGFPISLNRENDLTNSIVVKIYDVSQTEVLKSKDKRYYGHIIRARVEDFIEMISGMISDYKR